MIGDWNEKKTYFSIFTTETDRTAVPVLFDRLSTSGGRRRPRGTLRRGCDFVVWLWLAALVCTDFTVVSDAVGSLLLLQFVLSLLFGKSPVDLTIRPRGTRLDDDDDDDDDDASACFFSAEANNSSTLLIPSKNSTSFNLFVAQIDICSSTGRTSNCAAGAGAAVDSDSLLKKTTTVVRCTL